MAYPLLKFKFKIDLPDKECKMVLMGLKVFVNNLTAFQKKSITYLHEDDIIQTPLQYITRNVHQTLKILLVMWKR